MSKDDEDAVSIVLQQVDNCIQYGEDEDVQTHDDVDEDDAYGEGADDTFGL